MHRREAPIGPSAPVSRGALAELFAVGFRALRCVLEPERPREGAGQKRAIMREATYRRHMKRLDPLVAQHHVFWRRRRDARLVRWLKSATPSAKPSRHIRDISNGH